MAKTHYMKLYPGDYLRDTTHLDTVEHGAYFLLLMHAWVNDGFIPGDKKRLRKITGCAPRVWNTIGDVVLQFFDITDDGNYTHKRITAELGKAAQTADNSRENGKKGGRPKGSTKNPVGYSQVSKQKPRPNPDPNPEKPTSCVIAPARNYPLPEPEPIPSLRSGIACEGKSENKGQGEEQPRPTLADLDPDETQAIFRQTLKTYPKRSGGRNKIAEHTAYGQAILRHAPQVWLAAVERFAAYCDAAGNTGTQYVMAPQNFFKNPDNALNDWAVPEQDGAEGRVDDFSHLRRKYEQDEVSA